MSQENIDDPPTEILAETSNVSELRAQRVWCLARVAWFTWIFFTAYFWWREHTIGVVVSAVEVCLIQLIIGRDRQRSQYRRVMNLTLGVCACGILLVSISDQALRLTRFCFPVSILFASQLSGVRDALMWLLVNLLAHTMYFVMTYGPAEAYSWLHIDEVIIIYGVSICTFFCCQQGEAFYRDRTKGLVDLSSTLQKKSEWLEHLATTDSLTGLINRYEFLQQLRRRTNQTAEHVQRMALLLIDMNGFKEINDTLGHPVGDRALIEVANRLQDGLKDVAISARLGGDEFCLICPDIASVPEAKAIAERSCELLNRTYAINEFEFTMGASVGIALYPDHTHCATELLAFADTAMFCAKEKRIGFEVYDPNMTKQLIEHRNMQEKLSRALANNEFFLLYQPQVDIATQRVIAVEALVRWRHQGTVIPPVIFIPLLEKSREIIAVGQWIIREACRQLKVWEESGYDVGVSINLSSVQFNDPSFESNVLAPLMQSGVDARKVDFEITESLLIDDVNSATQRLLQLKETGATISVDDFGTGYSSLAYLRHFSLDRLKIDRAFVKDYPETDDGLIAKSIISLSSALGLKVLAEGVETQAQLEFLRLNCCDEYQGYFMSPPMPAEDVAKLFSLPFALSGGESDSALQAPQLVHP